MAAAGIEEPVPAQQFKKADLVILILVGAVLTAGDANIANVNQAAHVHGRPLSAQCSQ